MGLLEGLFCLCCVMPVRHVQPKLGVSLAMPCRVRADLPPRPLCLPYSALASIVWLVVLPPLQCLRCAPFAVFCTDSLEVFFDVVD
jgi:hypothetical protein